MDVDSETLRQQQDFDMLLEAQLKRARRNRYNRRVPMKRKRDDSVQRFLEAQAQRQLAQVD